MARKADDPGFSEMREKPMNVLTGGAGRRAERSTRSVVEVEKVVRSGLVTGFAGSRRWLLKVKRMIDGHQKKPWRGV